MIGEFELIARLAPRLVTGGPDLPVGHGDDAAVIDLEGAAACLAVDAVVEGRHFAWELSEPADVGWKALAVNVSDIAAMGAEPSAAVVALGRPADLAAERVEELYDGMAEAADHWGVALVGGDTVRTEELIVALTLLGRADPSRVVRRHGARPGDAIVCVGPLGAAGAGLRLALAGHDVPPGLLQAHRRPRGLVEAGRALAAGGATAMIDVSDGLGADLGHLAQASGVSVTVAAERLPVADEVVAAAEALDSDLWELVCGGGEDFALVAAAAPEEAARLAETAGATEGVVGAVIGEVLPAHGAPSVRLTVDGQVRDLDTLGYDHYAAEEGSDA